MKTCCTSILICLCVVTAFGQGKAESPAESDLTIVPFGEGGQLKMIYDRRQRPQAIYINDKVYMGYNGGSNLPGSDGRKTFPFVISYDPVSQLLSDPIRLGDRPDRDQHFCPIIWADKEAYLHILHGCHMTPGTHLVSNAKGEIGTSLDDWTNGSIICESMSYPAVFHIDDNKQLMYFRTGEHRSSWTYSISHDDGKTWIRPPTDVTDLNMGDELNVDRDPMELDEMSCYQTVLPSKDGKYLHVVFCAYDDNKKNLPEKFWNPRYKTSKGYGFKFNLYYVKVDLQTHEVVNFDGEQLQTPINMETADEKCMIWDTQWRGAGVPPDIILDSSGNPAFLHVLSADTPTTYDYWYVRFEDGEWKQTRIAPSSDDWNSCYLRLADRGTLYACLVMGEPFFRGWGAESSDEMDSRGGGDIEEWISTDDGNTWSKHRDLTPRNAEFAGWKFNNIQPVKDANMNVIPGMYLFYGWPHPRDRTAKGFLVLDELTKPKSKENHHVYLLIGQSNMAGRAPVSDDQTGVVERCFLLNGEDRWLQASNPLNRFSTIRKDVKMQKMNPGYGFSKAMLDAEKDISIGLVVNAKGGTKIEQWEKGTPIYAEAIRRAKIAQQSGVLKGILWHQGEGNSRKPEEYMDKLKGLIADLRKDLGDPDLPFVAGQVFHDSETKAHTKAINEVLGKLPTEVPFTGCVNSDGLSTYDNTHFDTASMLKLGKRYAEQIRTIMKPAGS